MARRWPVDAGEAEVLGELDRFLATGQLPTDQRRLDVSAADYARGILQRVAIEEERAQERRAARAARERAAMVQRVQADAAEQVRAAEERTVQRRLEFAASQVGKNFSLPYFFFKGNKANVLLLTLLPESLFIIYFSKMGEH
jgi:hypothetical protein